MVRPHNDQLWPAPVATGPVTATVVVPGSKSMTNRALVLAALADGRSRITGALLARDTTLMIGALQSLGTQIAIDGLDVLPATLRGDTQVDCGLAGTVMRFVPGVAALADGDVRFDGDPGARVRPMRGLLDSLAQLGVVISDTGHGTLPFTVHGRGSAAGGEVTIDSSSSSQFVSGLLLSGARYERGVVVHHRGSAMPSMPHVDMTVEMLREHGATVHADVRDETDATWTVLPGPLRPVDRVIEPDLSNAAPFLAAAVVTGGAVTIPSWPKVTTQAGDQLRGLLAALGANVELSERGLTVSGGQEVRGIDEDLHDVGELTPVLATICAMATSPSRLRGIGHLRGHETDRLAALATELSGLGAVVVETDDGLLITPKPLHAHIFATYHDHRMATAAAVAGLVVPGVQVVNVDTASKTLPGFTAMWEQMLGVRDDAA